MSEARVWTYVNWVAVCVMLILFLWKDYEVLDTLGQYATQEAISPFSDIYESSWFNDWHVSRLQEGKAFWAPGIIPSYFLPIAFIALQIYMCKEKDDKKLVTIWFAVPNIILGLQMAISLLIDTQLYLNVLPKTPHCGCLNSTASYPAIYDCQCVIPFIEGTVRVITVNPNSVTDQEYKTAGVPEAHIPSGNLTIKYIAETHDVNSLNTWDIEALVWVYALAQCSIFVVMIRLRQFYLYQKDELDMEDISNFGGIMSNFYYLIAESLDALSLYQEIKDHGYYFVDRGALVYYICLFANFSIVILMMTSSPLKNYEGKKAWIILPAQRLANKLIHTLLVNLPLLIIRCYLVSLYGDEVQIGIIFTLFIVREVVMLVMGILEVGFEIASLRGG